MISSKRRKELAFVENGVTEVKLDRGMLEKTLWLVGLFTATVTGAATAVRTHGSPIKRILLLAEGGEVLHSIHPRDAIKKAQIYEQTPLAALVTVPSGTAVAAYQCRFNIPIFLAQPFAGAVGLMTALPTWIYDEITLRVEWGSHAEVFVGGAGTVAAPVGNVAVVQDAAINYGDTDPFTLARSLGVSVDRFKEQASNGASSDYVVELPRTADLRAIMVTAEDANGQPSDAAITELTLLENNTHRVHSRVPYHALRADNAKTFGLEMPAGTAVIEFAEDQDITEIYVATSKDALDLVLGINAGAFTVRAHTVAIKPARAS